MNDVETTLKELEDLLGTAVGAADETVNALRAEPPENRPVSAASPETFDLLQSAQHLRLQLRDAHNFVVTRRAHPPFIDINQDEMPNILKGVRSLVEGLPARKFHGFIAGDVSQHFETIGALNQIVELCGPHGPISGPRGKGKRDVRIGGFGQSQGLGPKRPFRGLADNEL